MENGMLVHTLGNMLTHHSLLSFEDSDICGMIIPQGFIDYIDHENNYFIEPAVNFGCQCN